MYAVYSGLILVLLSCGVYLNILAPAQSVNAFDAAAVVSQMGKGEKSVFEDVRDSMKLIIEKGGIQGMIEVNEYALTNNLYGIYQCHVIAHLTGHEAVVYYGNDYETVVDHDTHFCELGYRHGAEAQVALSGGDYKEQLYAMCRAIKAKNPDADCFHGAGHAFMNESLDVDTSLALCDELINEEFSEDDIAACYNAVFAELTNLVGGRDGGTGIAYTGGPPLTMDEDTPLEYCSKFEYRYRIQCVFEFSGLGISEESTPEDIEHKLELCSKQDYEEEFEAACIRSVSAVGTQHELAQNHTIVVPEHILGLSAALREAYIRGAGTEMKQYLLSGADRGWEAFCGTFTVQTDVELCTSIFTN